MREGERGIQEKIGRQKRGYTFMHTYSSIRHELDKTRHNTDICLLRMCRVSERHERSMIKYYMYENQLKFEHDNFDRSSHIAA